MRLRVPESLGALREREFRLLFTGQAISLLGDGMVGVALAFAVLDLTGSVSDSATSSPRARSRWWSSCSSAVCSPTGSRDGP